MLILKSIGIACLLIWGVSHLCSIAENNPWHTLGDFVFHALFALVLFSLAVYLVLPTAA